MTSKVAPTDTRRRTAKFGKNADSRSLSGSNKDFDAKSIMQSVMGSQVMSLRNAVDQLKESGMRQLGELLWQVGVFDATRTATDRSR